MAFVAAHEPISAEELAEYADHDRSWVAVDPGDRPLGYVIVDVVDGCAHIEQVSVVPEFQNQGIGRSLIDAVDEWASVQGLDAITLTTFSEVEWNRPLYEHLGFEVLGEEELSPELKGIRDSETMRGLDPATRVCMRRPVSRIRSD
jgi:ribosomal protein S18 acetylase RimI-like enzyme